MILAPVLLGALLHVGVGFAAEPEIEPPDLAFRDGQVILTPGETNIALRFELFQRLLNEGAISPEEFQEHRRPNIGIVLAFTHEPGSVGLDGPVPTFDEVMQTFRELRRAVERGVAKVEEAAGMRTKVLSAILPPAPRARGARPSPPTSVMDALTLTSHLAGFRGRGVITEAEFEAERRLIDELAHAPPPTPAAKAEVPPAPSAVVTKSPDQRASAVPVAKAAAAKIPAKPKSPQPAGAPDVKAAAIKIDPAPNPSVPRFASIRGVGVKMHAGPGERYPVEWIYQRSSLPVEVIAHAEDWRHIRDPDGAEGWVVRDALTGRRTGMIKNGPHEMRMSADDHARTVNTLESGVIVDIRSCAQKANYCRIAVGGAQGWIRRDAVWGIYPDETID